MTNLPTKKPATYSENLPHRKSDKSAKHKNLFLKGEGADEKTVDVSVNSESAKVGPSFTVNIRRSARNTNKIKPRYYDEQIIFKDTLLVNSLTLTPPSHFEENNLLMSTSNCVNNSTSSSRCSNRDHHDSCLPKPVVFKDKSNRPVCTRCLKCLKSFNIETSGSLGRVCLSRFINHVETHGDYFNPKKDLFIDDHTAFARLLISRNASTMAFQSAL